MTDPSSSVHTSDGKRNTWEEDPLNHVIKAFIAFFQTIFENADRGCFHWEPNMEQTEVVITEESPVDLDVVEKKPVISLIQGPTRFNGSSLDDLLTVSIKDAREVHTDLLPGTMTINCLSQVRAEARYLAWQCARHVWILRKQFIRETHIHDIGRNIQIGSVSPAGALVQGDNESEWNVVPVNVPYFLQWTDSVTPLKHDWSGRPIHQMNNATVDLSVKARSTHNLTQNQEAQLSEGNPAFGEMASKTRNNSIFRKQALIKGPSIRGKAIKTQSQPEPDSTPLSQKAKA